ncbi:formimidoylglutamate deiminase [Roseovarius atlanticus]|uniref:formimidoylglutamate deiminase n=1 Tax=Roseovarius atlanticus TaxID=1641875 RepID=UPI001C9447F7|nr:formimidoylglutamate deiminase [Roseovarius atlanticus]MBY5988272.1 formimidoylglutamate deiminase [Roseovarius atlanticus]MBY6123663.1 formimidoylglutamate deiminase [Roseovarius atlanticus]MBY6148158.1 formimidoylglutamate deiminase [Roseovarius atlanticus]
MQEIQSRQTLTPDGWVSDLCLTIDQGRITRISRTPSPGAHTVDLLLPAPVNLHSHAFQRAMAGLTETRGPDPNDSFWTWRKLMYRFLDRLTPDHVQAIAELVFMEMLEAGYGAVAEFHYLHHDIGGKPYAELAEMAGRITTAATNTGIGLTLLPVHYMQGGCDGRALEGGQRRFGSDPELFARLHGDSARLIAEAPDDFAIGIAPHSLRAVPPDALAEARQICPQGPIHMHLAEQVAEVQEVEAHLGARPVEWLLDNADVTADWCLIHCTQMTDAETRALAGTGAVAGLCPITESSLGDGIFNGITYRDAGGRFGVGSDSNIHIALWEELATLDYSQRLRDRSRAAMATADHSTGRVLFDAAAQAGAQAAGRASGQIAEGRLADLIAVSTENEFLCNRSGDTALDSLIFTGRGRSCVTDVWSAGRHMVQNGRHVARDRITNAFLAVTAQLGQAI